MMITGIQKFIYIDKHLAVSQSGVQYIALDCLDEDNAKFSFISDDADVIKALNSVELSKFQELKLRLGFQRVFNPKTRFSSWQCRLLGVV